MKPGWVRRRGSDLIALGFGIPLLLFMWSMGHGGPTAMDRAITWSALGAPLVFVGIILWIFGRAKRGTK